MAEIKKFYTVKEVAVMLQVKPRTVYRLIENGEIQAGKVGNKVILIYEEQLFAFLRQNNFIK